MAAKNHVIYNRAAKGSHLTHRLSAFAYRDVESGGYAVMYVMIGAFIMALTALVFGVFTANAWSWDAGRIWAILGPILFLQAVVLWCAANLPRYQHKVLLVADNEGWSSKPSFYQLINDLNDCRQVLNSMRSDVSLTMWDSRIKDILVAIDMVEWRVACFAQMKKGTLGTKLDFFKLAQEQVQQCVDVTESVMSYSLTASGAADAHMAIVQQDLDALTAAIKELPE